MASGVKLLMEHFTKDSIIAGYYPLGDELDVRPILEHFHGLGNKVALPVVRKDGDKTWMEFRQWFPGQELQECILSKKILEPQETELLHPDIILAPLLCFSPQTCHRLGYGGAFYDRYLFSRA